MTAFFVGLDTAIALFKRHRWLLIGLPLAIGLGIQTFRLNSARADLLEKQAIISNMKLASEQARAAQLALNTANQELAQRIADNATLAHKQNRTAVDGAIASYVAANRLRQNDNGCSVRTSAAAVSSSTSTPTEEAQSAGLVTITEYDLGRLSKAAVQGDEAADFLIQLVNLGLAVPDTKNVP